MLRTIFLYENIKREALLLQLLIKEITNVENHKKNEAHPGLLDKTEEIKGSSSRAQVDRVLLCWEPSPGHRLFLYSPRTPNLFAIYPFYKVLKTEKKMQQRCMWPTKSKIFTLCSFIESRVLQEEKLNVICIIMARYEVSSDDGASSSQQKCY